MNDAEVIFIPGDQLSESYKKLRAQFANAYCSDNFKYLYADSFDNGFSENVKANALDWGSVIPETQYMAFEKALAVTLDFVKDHFSSLAERSQSEIDGIKIFLDKCCQAWGMDFNFE